MTDKELKKLRRRKRYEAHRNRGQSKHGKYELLQKGLWPKK